MKILKISLILLVPALGLVSCQKSGMKPCQQGNVDHTTVTTAEPEPQSAAQMNGRTMSPSMITGEGNSGIENSTAETETEGTNSELDNTGTGIEIVGSGDDEREGGKKKR
jgi:hypothetical protein